jgi:hypothetical protein
MLIAVCWRCESTVFAYSMMRSLPLCVLRSRFRHDSLQFYHGGMSSLPFAEVTKLYPSHERTHVGTIDALKIICLPL